MMPRPPWAEKHQPEKTEDERTWLAHMTVTWVNFFDRTFGVQFSAITREHEITMSLSDVPEQFLENVYTKNQFQVIANIDAEIEDIEIKQWVRSEPNPRQKVQY